MFTTVDKARGNASGLFVKRFIKPKASTMFGHHVHLMDEPGPSMSVSVPHEEFYNSYFAF